MTADALINALGCSLQMPSLCFGPERTCQLVFDQTWVVTLIDDSAREHITLICPLGPSGHANTLSPSTLTAMCQANFMGQGVAGMVLSIGQDQRPYLQAAAATANANVQTLNNCLELLLNQAELWSVRLNRGEPHSRSAMPSETTVGPASFSSWARQRV